MDPPPPAELAERLRAQPPTARVHDAFAEVEGAHLVGGAVRDLLLGRDAPMDLDVVVEGDAAAAAQAAAARLDGIVTAEHERFGTATVEAEDLRLDVTRARAESYPAPGALPEVRPATLAEDLARRDFTVNAIAVALHVPELGRLTAHPGALEDLDEGVLRILHSGSFVDDPTRLLRLVRYAARLGFEPDERTDALARDAVAAGAMGTVSAARVGDELRLLVAEPAALAALALARAMELHTAIHLDFDPRADLAERALELLPATDRSDPAQGAGTLLPRDGRRDLVVLAACCTRFRTTGDLTRWVDALEVPAAERDVVVAAALDADTLAEQLGHGHRPSMIGAVARGRPVEQVAMAGALGPATAARRWLSELRHVELEITGDDLLAAGVPEGPSVGIGLDAALAAKLDGEAVGREAELAVALQAAG
jgi:tRNA nucleotidyltransferase (CCA-adding enzyme)